MIDEELKQYIHSLLKQDYDLSTIRETLTKAGHDIKKVEELSSAVFELFHKDLLEYLESELAKGKTIDKIKEDLLKLGHSEKKLKQVMHYHKHKAPFYKRLHLHETLHREKVWFKSWISIYLYLFIAVLIILIAVTVLIVAIEPAPRPKTFDKRLALCNELGAENMTDYLEVQLYQKNCLALISYNPAACAELADKREQTKCRDGYFLYSFYRQTSHENCNKIKDPSLKEFCSQIYDKSCNNFLGHDGYCQSITNSDLSECSSKSHSTSLLVGDCFDNFYFYKAMRGDRSRCDEINDFEVRTLCQAVS